MIQHDLFKQISLNDVSNNKEYSKITNIKYSDYKVIFDNIGKHNESIKIFTGRMSNRNIPLYTKCFENYKYNSISFFPNDNSYSISKLIDHYFIIYSRNNMSYYLCDAHDGLIEFLKFKITSNTFPNNHICQ